MGMEDATAGPLDSPFQAPHVECKALSPGVETLLEYELGMFCTDNGHSRGKRVHVQNDISDVSLIAMIPQAGCNLKCCLQFYSRVYMGCIPFNNSVTFNCSHQSSCC